MQALPHPAVVVSPAFGLAPTTLAAFPRRQVVSHWLNWINDIVKSQLHTAVHGIICLSQSDIILQCMARQLSSVYNFLKVVSRFVGCRFER